MSETTASMLSRFLGLPRAIQWAALAAVGVALFLGWDSIIAPMIDDLNKKSVAIEAEVQQIRNSTRLVDELRKPELERVVVGIGAVKAPRSPATGTRAFTDVVNGLMKKHGISDQDFSLRSGRPLPKNVLVQVLNSRRGERLTGELKFSAKPEVALTILAALESSPDIEQVSGVRMTKDQAGKIRVQYTLEAWVIASEGSAGGAGASL